MSVGGMVWGWSLATPTDLTTSKVHATALFLSSGSSGDVNVALNLASILKTVKYGYSARHCLHIIYQICLNDGYVTTLTVMLLTL